MPRADPDWVRTLKRARCPWSPSRGSTLRRTATVQPRLAGNATGPPRAEGLQTRARRGWQHSGAMATLAAWRYGAVAEKTNPNRSDRRDSRRFSDPSRPHPSESRRMQVHASRFWSATEGLETFPYSREARGGFSRSAIGVGNNLRCSSHPDEGTGLEGLLLPSGNPWSAPDWARSPSTLVRKCYPSPVSEASPTLR
jgi:hypothetical protein